MKLCSQASSSTVPLVPGVLIAPRFVAAAVSSGCGAAVSAIPHATIYPAHRPNSRVTPEPGHQVDKPPPRVM